MYKISDFIIPHRIIQSACKSKKQPFIDLEVEFGDGEIGLLDNKLFVGNPFSIAHTFYNISYLYLNNFDKIHTACLFDSDIQKSDILVLLANFLRSLSYSENFFPEAKPSTPIINYLYRWPIVWLLMKDLICPSFQVPIKNCKIISFNSSFIDTSVYVDKKYMEMNNITNYEVPFIFVNTDIEYEPYINASLLFSAIKAHGLNPSETIYNIYNSILKDKLVGFSNLSFVNDKKANDFISLLLTVSGMDNKSENLIADFKKVSKGSDIIKTAQSFDQVYGNWWYLGVLEKMLEPVRGSDWSTHNRLQPFLDALWNKIEIERKKHGRDGLNYEALLRVKAGENDPNKTTVFENMLASDRVW